MRQLQRLLFLSGALVLVSGCGSTSVGTESGTIAAPGTATGSTVPPVTPPKASSTTDTVSGTNDTVISTSSAGSNVSVAVGASQTVNVVFTSSDGMPMTGFAVNGSLSALPAGWSGPASFTCAAVGPGSGCVLTLTYAPKAVDSGTLSLVCVFVDNAKTPRTPGPCLSLTYASTAANNVVATASQSGEVDAVMGAGAQALSVNFTTDDGNPATAWVLTTDLHSLPAGWSSTATSLSCPVVRAGNGCQLPLSFAPAAAANATLNLAFSYVDNTGASRAGSVNIPYASVPNGTVVGTTAPSGQVNAIETTGATAVAVTFTTTDGKGATNLGLMTDLSTLPAGWSSTTSTGFGCASLSTGNGCQLHLKYAPAALTSGNITLRYAYSDENGDANVGLVNVLYAATTDDNVIATPSTTGEIDSMVGSSQPVTVTFTTDDGRAATGLHITGDLTALPSGWSSSAPAFTCVTVQTGTNCQLVLTDAPTTVGSGTVSLGFSYVNNAGATKTGTLNIPYRVTANDHVVPTANPLTVTAVTGSNNAVTVTFNTDDGNLATGLTADLTGLPPEWTTATPSFSCLNISTGSGCMLSLSYAPTAAANSTLSFTFGYINNAGTTLSGSVSIPYSSAP
jgi:hypothetical protein